jgi:hypothetical protein
MVKNEGLLLDSILPIWKQYPVDLFVFYDDNSTDNTVEIIKNHLDADRYLIFNDKLEKFNESHNRFRMIEYSRDKSDYIFCIDCDELLSSNILSNIDEFTKIYDTYNLQLYWYNVVDSLGTYRYDNSYKGAFGGFVTKSKFAENMNLSLSKYHTSPRYVNNKLPTNYTNHFGIIHLQSLNRKYYALKQLWYKHFEYKTWNHSISELNSKYDPVVNNFEFNLQSTPAEIIKNINLDSKIFDEICDSKGYLRYINENYVEDLVTFGKKFMNPYG